MKELQFVYGFRSNINGAGYTFYSDAGDLSQDTGIRMYTQNGVMSCEIRKSTKYSAIQNLSELQEEEFFQLSLVWDYPCCIERIRAVQAFGTELFKNPEQSVTLQVLASVQYE